ncbi:MAG: TetR/AcrR family transcriptional regulator [Cumulibacter sp.]
MPEALSLREQKKNETRKAISQAALALTYGRPYADVTVAEIAAAAGVSRRTISNYFASKADCYAGVIGGEFVADVIQELLAQDSGGTGERLTRAFQALDESFWTNVQRLHTIARDEPEVAAAVAFAEQSKCDELADLLMEASADSMDRLRLKATIAAISTCITVAVDYWLDNDATGGTAALTALVTSSLGILDLSWADPHLSAIRELYRSNRIPRS